VETDWQTEATASREAPAPEVPEQLARFLEDHLRRIYILIYRLVRNSGDAQDLTQEVFIKVWRRQGQLRERRKAASWLSSIARNTAIDFLRRKRPATSAWTDDLDKVHDENPERILLRAERQAKLSAGLRLLTERERTALILRDVEDLPAEDVAAILECSKATVRCHIANGREKFRRYLNRIDRCQ
jgi:RNA polymerase sigma-70 factor (ECF subfamily)